jgi:hypothetical protein
MEILLAAAILAQDYLPVPAESRTAFVVEDLGAEAAEAPREVVAESGAADADGWVPVRGFLGYERAWIREKDGVVEFRIDPEAGAPALVLLKSAAGPGGTWTGSLGREALSFTLRGEQAFELGDERVTALHVAFRVSEPDRHRGHEGSHGDLWFVAGRGLVQAELTKDLDCHTHLTRRWRAR